MSATAAATTDRLVDPDQVVTLYVGPGGLDRYLQLIEDRAGPRIKYFQGSLTLVSPSRPHERDGDSIDQVIQAIGEELDIDFYALASTLYRHDPREVGIEPDKSYLIARADDDRPRLEPDHQPIPDLVVEVVASHPPNNSLRICQALGIPEVWTYRVAKHTLEFLVLGEDGRYAVVQRSLAFPFLAPADVLPWILQDPDQPEPGNRRRQRLRAWVRDTLGPRRATEAAPAKGPLNGD